MNEFEKLRDPSHYRCLGLAEWVDGFQQAGFTLQHQETAWKEIAFNDRALRMGASDVTVAHLRTMLLDAPPAAAEFLQPQASGDNISFYLTEAIVVGTV